MGLFLYHVFKFSVVDEAMGTPLKGAFFKWFYGSFGMRGFENRSLAGLFVALYMVGGRGLIKSCLSHASGSSAHSQNLQTLHRGEISPG